MNDKTKLALINDFDKVLSLNLTTAQADAKEEIDAELESYVLAKIEERKEAKKAKDFAKADAIRDELLAKGIVLKEYPRRCDLAQSVRERKCQCRKE